MIEKLIIGTANFGQEYNGHQVPADEIEKIWEYCVDVGINYADTATAYNYEPPTWVKVISKIIGENDKLSNYANLVHHTKDIFALWPMLWELKWLFAARFGTVIKIGVSIYDLDEITCLSYDIIQLPYSSCKDGLADLKKRGIEIHARSVFRDDVYKEALLDPNVDFVVIGIDNLAQLKENVEIARNLEKGNENGQV